MTVANMEFAEHYREGFEAGSEMSDFDACLWPLLQSLGWQGLPRQVAEALPHLRGALDITDFRNTLANLNYATREVETTLDAIDDRLMPCLFVPDTAPALVVIRPAYRGIEIFDGGTGKQVTIAPRKNKVTGKAYFVRRVDPEEHHLDAQSGSWFRGITDRFSQLGWQLLLITLLLNVFALATPIFTMGIYDRVVAQQSTDMLIQFAVGIAIAIALDAMLRALRSQIIAHFAARLDTLVSGAILERILSLPPVYTERAAIGAQVARIRDFESVREFFTGPLAMVFLEVPFLPIFIVVLVLLGGPLALIPVALAVVFALAALLILPLVAKRVAEQSKAGARRQEFLVETVGKMRALKYTGAEDHWFARFREISADAAYAGFRTAVVNGFVAAAAQAMMIGSGALVLGFGALRVMDGLMSVGALVASMMLVWRVLSPLQTGFVSLPRIAQLRGSVEQINRLMRIRAERDLAIKTVGQKRFDGRVTFSRVSLRYSGESDPALVGVSMDVPPGQVVAIVGPNGAGKSTLIKLIAGMYQPQAGAVLIDGSDIRQMDPLILRQSISYVPQEVDFFRGSIAQNLRLAGPTASMQALRMACRQAVVLDEIMALPDGFDTRIGDQHSQRFSASFLQRLALARAFVKDSPIMLFDEPTTGLDFEADQAFIAAIRRLRGGATIFLVTHRPSHVQVADRVVVLDGGHLRADGPPDKLVDRLIEGGYL